MFTYFHIHWIILLFGFFQIHPVNTPSLDFLNMYEESVEVPVDTADLMLTEPTLKIGKSINITPNGEDFIKLLQIKAGEPIFRLPLPNSSVELSYMFPNDPNHASDRYALKAELFGELPEDVSLVICIGENEYTISSEQAIDCRDLDNNKCLVTELIHSKDDFTVFKLQDTVQANFALKSPTPILDFSKYAQIDVEVKFSIEKVK